MENRNMKGIFNIFRTELFIEKSGRRTMVIVVGCLYGSGMTKGFGTLLT